jgi:putative SOS response-associated peptidase YedK
MCGRYASMRDTADQVQLTGAADETGPEQDDDRPDPVQSANVAPTDRVRVLLAPDRKRVLRRHVWGLIPPWSKSREGAARMINARVETVVDKPAYRRAVRTSRCLLPADAWYEWQVGEQGRVPHLVKRADGRPLWLAGLWSRWHPPDGGPPIASASVLTGPAPSELTWLHERAPLVVPDPFMDEWLASDGEDPRGVLDTLTSVGYPPLEWYRVGRGIGQVRDKGAHLMLPAPESGIEVAPPEPAVLF